MDKDDRSIIAREKGQPVWEVIDSLYKQYDDLQKQVNVGRANKRIEELTPNKLENNVERNDERIVVDRDRKERQIIWDQNRQYFLDHEKEFSEKYPGFYVAVHENRVLDTGENPAQLAGKMYEKYGNIPLYVSKPDEKEIETIHLPIVSEWTHII